MRPLHNPGHRSRLGGFGGVLGQQIHAGAAKQTHDLTFILSLTFCAITVLLLMPSEPAPVGTPALRTAVAPSVSSSRAVNPPNPANDTGYFAPAAADYTAWDNAGDYPTDFGYSDYNGGSGSPDETDDGY